MVADCHQQGAGEEAEHPHKYKIAYSYFTTRLGELRAEERCRVRHGYMLCAHLTNVYLHSCISAIWNQAM